MKDLVCFCLISLLLVSFSLSAQNEKIKDSIYKELSEAPRFSLYKNNYFISGIPDHKAPHNYNSDIKFQISFKYRILDKPLVLGSYLHLTYTQKSFWDIYRKASPFRETNYNPGLMFSKPIFIYKEIPDLFSLSVEHESNGLEIKESRSWNIIGFKYTRFFSERLKASLKLWIPFATKGNATLMDYIGYGQAEIEWMPIKNKLYLDILARKGAKWDTKGSVQAGLSYKPFGKINLALMLQWWKGYGESLNDYDRSRGMVRAGFIMRPKFSKTNLN